MGLFGKKKTPEEILKEGIALYVQGEYNKASIVLLKSSDKLGGEIDYWIGRSMMAEDARNGKAPGKSAKRHLQLAANAGIKEAAALLEGKPIDEPATDDVTADEALTRGSDAYTNKNYEDALKWWKKAAELGDTAAQVNIACMYHMGEGTAKNENAAFSGFTKLPKAVTPARSLTPAYIISTAWKPPRTKTRH